MIYKIGEVLPDNVIGIYKITCQSNNKFYIGSSTNIKIRLTKHVRLLKKNKHWNKFLQNTWNKYTQEAFSLEIIEITNEENLLEREQYWLDYTKCYNNDIGFNSSKTVSKVFDNSKSYIVTNPEGVEIEVSNLEKYCRDNNISSSIRNIAIGRVKTHYSGYSCRYKTDSIEDCANRRKKNGGKYWQSKKYTYIIKYQDGTIDTTNVFTNYCKEKGLYLWGFYKLKKGMIDNYKGIVEVIKSENSGIRN